MTLQKRIVTKEEAATAQLDTSIKLYFENRDLISAHTLASAAMGIVSDLYKNRRDSILGRQIVSAEGKVELQFAFVEEWELRAKPEHRNELFRAINASQNFFKHADRDPDTVHEFNDWRECGIKIFMSIVDHYLVFETISPAQRVFQAVYLMLRPNLLQEGSVVREQIDEFMQQNGFARENELTREQISYVGLTYLKQSCPEMFAEPDINSII